MARARLTADWDRTAPVLSLLHQQFRVAMAVAGLQPGPPKDLFDFHLYRDAPKTKGVAATRSELPKLPVSVLKDIFVKQH